MVGSTDEHASRAGLQMLQQGGNAVDAAVAVGFALAVTHPAAGNLGGGGFMVIRMADGRETTIDYREVAPGRGATATCSSTSTASRCPSAARSARSRPACPARWPDWPARNGATDGCRWPTVIAPAIALARDGFEVSWALADSLKGAQGLLAKFPASARAFRRADGTMPAAGDRLVQPDLAKTLDAHREPGTRRVLQGPDRGSDRRRDGRGRGGLITKADLAAYAPRERAADRRHVSRPSGRLDAAAQLRRHRAGAAAQHPRGLPARRDTATTRRARFT